MGIQQTIQPVSTVCFHVSKTCLALVTRIGNKTSNEKDVIVYSIGVVGDQETRQTQNIELDFKLEFKKVLGISFRNSLLLSGIIGLIRSI